MNLQHSGNRSGGQTETARNTVFLQAIAALLIANSHLEGLYPKSWMAADGFIGNSIFFLLSGYGITISLSRRQQTFVQYYIRRILRIYPALWLTEVLFRFLLQGLWKSAGWQDLLEYLIYPTAYGYVRQIMVFYAFFFLLKPWLRAGTLLALIAGLCLPLVGIYAFDVWRHPMEHLQLGAANEWIWPVYFFQIMLLGGYLALRKNDLPARTAPTLLSLGAALAAYVALKFVMVLGVRVPGFGFSSARLYFALFALIPPIVWQIFALGTSVEWLNWLKKYRPINWIVGLIGGLTLEIYIVHWFVFENERVSRLAFPLNVALFFLVTIVLRLGPPHYGWRSPLGS